jgi:TRAP-type C4-dicarboxylate transport system substrate-binding protein
MKKKGFSALLNGISVICVVVVALFLMVAISSDAQPRKPIELKYATHSTPAHHNYTDGALVWIKNVENATGGRVKITPYPSETLCKGKDTLEAVKGGIADIAHAFVGLFPGRFPVTEVAFLPTMPMDPNSTSETSTRVIMEAYHKIPEMQAEYRSVKLLWLHTMQPCFVATNKKMVRKLEDLKGLKLRIAGTYITDYMKNQGAVPVLIPPSELYENMQKGVIDGYAYSWDGFLSRRLYEVTDYVTDARWYTGAFFTIMNLDVWNKLPADIQKAIESVTGIENAVLMAKQYDRDTAPALELCKKRNIEVIKLSREEIARWKQAAKPTWERWIKDVEKKGISSKRSQEILDETVKIYEKYGK